MKLRFSKRTGTHDVLVFDDDVVNVVELDSGLLVGTVTFTEPSLIEAFRSALDFITGDEEPPVKSKGSPVKKARKPMANA